MKNGLRKQGRNYWKEWE